MAGKFVHKDVFDRGLEEVKNNANQMSLITSFAPGDAYALVASRSVCDIAMTAADLIINNYGTTERKIDVAAKQGTASAASPVSSDLHIALLDTVGQRVMAVADETSDQPVTSGNPVAFPAWELRGRQPV